MFEYGDDALFGFDDDAAYRPNCDDMDANWDVNDVNDVNEPAEQKTEDYSLESLEQLDMTQFGDDFNAAQPYLQTMVNKGELSFQPEKSTKVEPWYDDMPVPEDEYRRNDYQNNNQNLESHYAAAFGEPEAVREQAVQPPEPSRPIERAPAQHVQTPSPAVRQADHAKENLEDSGFIETTSPQHYQPPPQRYQAPPKCAQPAPVMHKRPSILKNVKKPLITQYRSITTNQVYPVKQQQYTQVRIGPNGYRQEGGGQTTHVVHTQRLQTANTAPLRVISSSQGLTARPVNAAQPRIHVNPYRPAPTQIRRQSIRQSDPERQRLHAEAKVQAEEVLRYVEMRQNKELRWSFPNMVGFALLNSDTGELPVADIYSFIIKHFPSYKNAPQGWKNSVRHALSKSGVFHKNETLIDGRMERRRCLWSVQEEKINKMLAEINKQMKKEEAGGRYANHYEASYTPMTQREHPYGYKRKHVSAHSSSGGVTNVAMKRPAILSRGLPITTERPITSGFGHSISINKSSRIPSQQRARSPIMDPMDIPLFTEEDDNQRDEERYDGPLRPTFDPASISLFDGSEQQYRGNDDNDLDIPDDCAFENFFVQSPPTASAESVRATTHDDFELSPEDEELLRNPLAAVKGEYPGDDEEEEEPFIKKRKQEPARIKTELRDDQEPSSSREHPERKYFDYRDKNAELRNGITQ